jgi:predicted dehydrogenase
VIPTISLDLGVHVHQMIDFLTGEKPIELVAIQNSQGNFKQVVDNSMCIARYTNNLVCNIWYSKAALGYRNGLRVRVFGEKASIEWYQMDPEFLIYHDNAGRKITLDRANADIEIANDLRYNRFKSGHPAGFLEAFANH